MDTMDTSTYRKHRPRGPMLWKFTTKYVTFNVMSFIFIRFTHNFRTPGQFLSFTESESRHVRGMREEKNPLPMQYFWRSSSSGQSQFQFLGLITTQVFEFCCYLCFWVLLLFEFCHIMSFDFFSLTIWVFVFCQFCCYLSFLTFVIIWFV